MTLSAMGLALTPAGGSVCIRLKSRIKRLRAAVDMVIGLGPLRGSKLSLLERYASRLTWNQVDKRVDQVLLEFDCGAMEVLFEITRCKMGHRLRILQSPRRFAEL
jgi:hypothetical protein